MAFACSNEGDKPKNGKPKLDGVQTGLQKNKATATFTVTDEAGKPLAAEVLVGTDLNAPFPNNLVQTDAQGQATVPAAWQSQQPVTVRSPGYVSVTYLGQDPQSLSFRLRVAPVTTRMELKGTTSGYQIQNNDGQVDFGLIMKGMTKFEALAFDINKVISPESDIIKIVGKETPIPSNVSFPKQRESYVLPITLDKNPYRLYFNQPGQYKILGLKGRFPFKTVVDGMRAEKTFADLVNYFTIEGGTMKDAIISGQHTLDLNVAEMKFTESVAVTAPVVQAGEVVLAVTAQDIGGVMMPNDVKKLLSGETMNLRTASKANAHILKVLKRESEFDSTVNANAGDRLSAIVSSPEQPANSTFLPLIENPVVQGQTLMMTAMTAVPGIESYATYLVLSELQEIQSNGTVVKIPLHRWEIYVPGWVNHIDLPQRPFSNQSPKWRWEVSFLGGIDAAPVLGPDMINKTTHVTRSSTDF